jgi:hypothetical protein
VTLASERSKDGSGHRPFTLTCPTQTESRSSLVDHLQMASDR